jgi:hypothetical protein
MESKRIGALPERKSEHSDIPHFWVLNKLIKGNKYLYPISSQQIPRLEIPDMLRRPQTASARSREFKLRLPEDVADRIEAKAKAEGRPQNRIIINELAAYPRLEKIGELDEHVAHLENLLLKHSARIEWQELAEQLLAAVDEVLNTQGAAQQVAIDKLRAVRSAMLKRKG